MLKVKNHNVLRRILEVPYHPTLIELLQDIMIRYSTVVVTSGYRPGDVDRGGIHGTIPCRAIDIRSWIYPDPQAICGDINSRWRYDPDRPDYMCAIYHDVGRGEHIHLQVHNDTRGLL